MCPLTTLARFAWLAGVASASYSCISFDVPMSFEGQSNTTNFPHFKNRYDSVQFLNDITARNASSGPPAFGTAVSISVDVTVAAQYCTPNGGKTNGVVQVLTHGIGFDHSYWDFGGPDSEYNYIKAATEAGYATLSYDRIGTGKSTKTDPYSTQQVGVEVEVLSILTTHLRNGTLSSFAKSGIPKPTKVAHIGHSFGSVISEVLAGAEPSLTDGIVLTAFSTSTAYGGEFAISSNFHPAAEAEPERFAGLSKGYLTWGDELANQYSFFAWPYFDPEVLRQAEATKQPFAVSEFLQAFGSPQPDYGKPLLIISGAEDRIFCGGDCYGILDEARAYFPKAKPYETYIQPDTGHGMNLHYNATGTYGVIMDFVAAHVG